LKGQKAGGRHQREQGPATLVCQNVWEGGKSEKKRPLEGLRDLQHTTKLIKRKKKNESPGIKRAKPPIVKNREPVSGTASAKKKRHTRQKRKTKTPLTGDRDLLCDKGRTK